MISWLKAKISLNYLYPVAERIILVFCCQSNYRQSWPDKNCFGEQWTLLASCWLILEAAYTFFKIYYKSGIYPLDISIGFSHISVLTMLFQTFQSSKEDEPFTSFFKEQEQPPHLSYQPPLTRDPTLLTSSFPTDVRL